MPKLLPIIPYNNPQLRATNSKVALEELKKSEFKNLLEDMSHTMLKQDGAGLAAPQIGRNISLALINTKEGIIALINPVITKKSWNKETDQEGCLSVPGIYGQVKRHKKIICQYLDRDAKLQQINAEGLLARVIQHELDHLEGILFIDKTDKLEKID